MSIGNLKLLAYATALCAASACGLQTVDDNGMKIDGGHGADGGVRTHDAGFCPGLRADAGLPTPGPTEWNNDDGGTTVSGDFAAPIRFAGTVLANGPNDLSQLRVLLSSVDLSWECGRDGGGVVLPTTPGGRSFLMVVETDDGSDVRPGVYPFPSWDGGRAMLAMMTDSPLRDGGLASFLTGGTGELTLSRVSAAQVAGTFRAQFRSLNTPNGFFFDGGTIEGAFGARFCTTGAGIGLVGSGVDGENGIDGCPGASPGP